MDDVKIKKGYRFRMAGAPSMELASLADPLQVAFLPEKIPYIKPRLKVAEGDVVQIGSLLFEDKRNPEFQFLSPAGGVVRRIQFGPRRVVEAIVIDRDRNREKRLQFPSISAKDLESMDRSQLVDHILKGGLWWTFRQLPFRNLPDPEAIPPAIIVGLSAKEPFQPSPKVYLRDRFDLMTFGLKVLKTLSQDRVMVFSNGDTPPPEEYHSITTHRVWGNYPSDDAGAFLYYIKSSAEQNRAWYISGQDLILLAQLLAQGQYPVDRIVSVAGSSAPKPRHFRTRLGVPLAHLVDNQELDDDVRFVVGGLFKGFASDRRGFMGHCETALNLVPKGSEAEFLALFNPGLEKPTYSRTFLSRLNPSPLVYNCNLHGGERACIACMYCTDVCPVDMMPHMTYKAILADEVEEFLEHGLLDCVECGLCTYVCPSKIELTRTFIDAKAAYAKEQGG
ncbi:MAG: 4Fe-4S dicluster domain-containing protein [Desulfobacteraceae bacterium]|jgi:Na+-transporting NADH:ubiquinone oxidoreductase subunit A